MSDLEQRLRELPVDWPPTPDLAATVRARLEARRRPSRWRRLLAGLLLVLGGALAVEPARSAILEVLGFDAVRIERREPVATPGAGAALGLGEPVTVPVATRRHAPPLALGRADGAYVDRFGTVSYVYDGGRLLVQILRGDIGPLIQKAVGQGTKLSDVTVEGARGYWISGGPHGFAYRREGSEPVFEDQRLAGPTLLVERDDLTVVRVEGRVSRARAIEIAASVP